ncbi:MAG TPA: hypothetical protein VJV78_33585 [Polyangiales bacterium]|nr:hypothetical protein [Polyangiales bacterium]
MRPPPIFGRINAEWQRFTRALPGERFIEYYEHHQRRASEGLLALTYFATFFCVGMAILLCFVSGPAWIYWLLSAVLLPGESRRAAVVLDRVERTIRRLVNPRARHGGYDVVESEILPNPPRPRPTLRPRRTTSAPPPPAAAVAAPERRVTDPRAVWLNTRAGGVSGAARMRRTQKLWAPEPPPTRTPVPVPVPLDRRTPTPT